MAADYAFTDDETAIDVGLGFPKAYAKICRDRHDWPFSLGPPFTFTPYALQQHEGSKMKKLEQIFPVIDPKAKPTAKPKIFVSLLWNQLNHLGNAGFDPAVIRVDPYGNVLYYHADSASPLAWDIDHWFPCSRGGLTVPSNLRILQWQVCRRKHKKLEFQVPWWDLQLGISVNQFLSIFDSSNSDFRHRAFSFLFAEGENEEMNSSQTVESHSFPQHFVESKQQLGLAPAAIVVTRREPHDSALKSLDYNRQIVATKGKPSLLKENENPDFDTNPYQAIVMARDSLKHRGENRKMKMEIRKLDEEVNETMRKNDAERMDIQDLEAELIKRRRRAEKCRRLAEAQSSYRIMLEKMIRDAMHQSVVYKEQVRLNQAATNALMARLEAQKAICDAAEKELHKKFKQRDELEKQIGHEWEQARKRSRMDDTLSEEIDRKSILYLPEIRPRNSVHKELRVFLEERKASEAGLSSNEEQKCKEIEEAMQKSRQDHTREKAEDHDTTTVSLDDKKSVEHNLQERELCEEEKGKPEINFTVLEESDREEDEEHRRQRGKGNVERWLKILLENNTHEDANDKTATDEIIRKLDHKYPHKTKEECVEETQLDKQYAVQEKDCKRERETIEEETNELPREVQACDKGTRGSKETSEKKGKEKILVRSQSARAFRRIPSSPSLLLSVKKGVDCIRKKPMVTSEEEDHAAGSNFLKSSIKTIKKAVKI